MLKLMALCMAISASHFVAAQDTFDTHTEQYRAPVRNSSINKKTHPKVEAQPWWVTLISCQLCKDFHNLTIYTFDDYLPISEEHRITTNKKAKGLLHLFCIFTKEQHTCTRFIEVYSTLLFTNIFEGVFSEEYFCGVIIPACEFQRETLENYIDQIQEYK